MRAEEGDYTLRVNVEMSQTDAADGIRVVPSYRTKTLKIGPSTTMNYKPEEVSIGTVLKEGDAWNLMDFSKAEVASDDDKTTYGYSWQIVDGNTLLDSGKTSDSWSLTTMLQSTPFSATHTNVTVQISVFVDAVGADNAGSDDVDDRLQTTYGVHVETGIDSNLYEPVKPYTVNNGDNLAKKVASGDYVNLPGLYDEKYDSDDNEYVLVYTIDGDDIYANWELASKVKDRFTAVSSNDKDTNGDGKVSCDEYYGTTGLEWSDKLNACVVSSTGDAVVTIPNTATK